MDDELDLGLTPSTKRKHTVAGAPQPTRTWRLYKAKDPAMCALCIVQVEKVNNFPKSAVNRALFVEHGPDGNVHLCALHKQEREELFGKEGA